jgi:dGTPase
MKEAATPAGTDAGAYGASLKPGERAPAAYAASAPPSRGRRHGEPECPTRSPFQRDRDRVLHSTAFRRLVHKTQVFIFHEGDHYRTRLTHSLEVAQIARTIARQVRLDEDLAETLALAHDLGHPPFGHAGERALDVAMRAYGGFEHNAQSLRVVMHLERKYLGFDGLNLTWETLEGLAKHNGPIAEETAGAVLKVIKPIEDWLSLEPARWASAEAQVAALSDDIAYVTHDIDDGLRAGLVALSDLEAVPFVGEVVRSARVGAATSDEARVIYEVSRRMITEMIGDVVTQTRRRLGALAPRSPDDIRGAGAAVALFSEPMAAEFVRLKVFLTERVYQAPRVTRAMAGAGTVVADLFARYLRDGAAMPETWRLAAAPVSDRRRARLIGDFVAGMTDRYAIAEHRRLFDATPELR